jgi:hypothetical protein
MTTHAIQFATLHCEECRRSASSTGIMLLLAARHHAYLVPALDDLSHAQAELQAARGKALSRLGGMMCSASGAAATMKMGQIWVSLTSKGSPRSRELSNFFPLVKVPV